MPREKTIPCPDCDQMFSAPTMLAVHRVNKHPDSVNGASRSRPAPHSQPTTETAAAKRPKPAPAAPSDDDDDDLFGDF